MDERDPMPAWQAIVWAAALGFGTDFVWAEMTIAVANHEPGMAAIWSALLSVCGVCTTRMVVKEDWTSVVVFIVCGALGMWWSVSRS